MMATASNQQKEERQRRLGDDVGILAAHGLQHEQVEADRRRDLRHLHHQHDEDAEPDQIEAGRLIIGITTAVVSTIIEMPSSAVPSTMYMTVSAAISA